MGIDFSREIAAFQTLWSGGYYEGDPLDPLAVSGYGELGFISVLHATYLRCVKPYITGTSVALEIGPGRGAWTKALLPSKEVYALDALPEEHNRFFKYLGNPKHVKYFQVQDLNCDMLPDSHFNYMFSFGCLCHVSFAGITEYARNLFPKLVSGSNCFWMIGDYDKWNAAIANRKKLSIDLRVLSMRRRYLPIRWLAPLFVRSQNRMREPDLDNEPRPGRWYHAGTDRTCDMLEGLGYEIIDRDVGTCLRDPIVHFTKP